MAGRDKLTLQQEFAPPAQRNLVFDRGECFFAREEGRLLATLSLPPPGQPDGPRDFAVFVETPDNTERTPVGPGSARGFFVQAVGALAGRSDFARGTVQVQPDWLHPARRVLTLDVQFADGAALRGRFTLADSPPDVHAFQRRFAADIAALRPKAPAGPAGSLAGDSTVPAAASPAGRVVPSIRSGAGEDPDGAAPPSAATDAIETTGD